MRTTTPVATAATIASAARAVIEKGYAGGAYISDVAEHLHTTPAKLAPALFAAMRTGALELRRADLVAALDRAKVEASELKHPALASAVYHFVVVT